MFSINMMMVSFSYINRISSLYNICRIVRCMDRCDSDFIKYISLRSLRCIDINNDDLKRLCNLIQDRMIIDIWNPSEILSFMLLLSKCDIKLNDRIKLLINININNINNYNLYDISQLLSCINKLHLNINILLILNYINNNINKLLINSSIINIYSLLNQLNKYNIKINYNILNIISNYCLNYINNNNNNISFKDLTNLINSLSRHINKYQSNNIYHSTFKLINILYHLIYNNIINNHYDIEGLIDVIDTLSILYIIYPSNHHILYHTNLIINLIIYNNKHYNHKPFYNDILFNIIPLASTEVQSYSFRPADSSPPEVQSNSSSTRRGASSIYLSLKSRATPGDRGEEKLVIGPQVEPVADLREAEGQLNRRAPCNGKKGPQVEADGRRKSGGDGMKSSTGPRVEPVADLREAKGELNGRAVCKTKKGRKENSTGPRVEPVSDLRELEGEINRRGTTTSGDDSDWTSGGAVVDSTSSEKGDYRLLIDKRYIIVLLRVVMLLRIKRNDVTEIIYNNFINNEWSMDGCIKMYNYIQYIDELIDYNIYNKCIENIIDRFNIKYIDIDLFFINLCIDCIINDNIINIINYIIENYNISINIKLIGIILIRYLNYNNLYKLSLKSLNNINKYNNINIFKLNNKLFQFNNIIFI